MPRYDPSRNPTHRPRAGTPPAPIRKAHPTFAPPGRPAYAVGPGIQIATIAACTLVDFDQRDDLGIIHNGRRLRKGKDFRTRLKMPFLRDGGGLYIEFITSVIEGDSLDFEYEPA